MTTDAPGGYYACMTTSDAIALLREYIDASGETMTAIAEDLDMSLQQLGHIVHGRRLPTIRQAVDIEEVAGIPVAAWVVR